MVRRRHSNAVQPNFKVQVWPCDPAARAHITDNPASINGLSFANLETLQMRVAGL